MTFILNTDSDDCGLSVKSGFMKILLSPIIPLSFSRNINLIYDLINLKTLIFLAGICFGQIMSAAPERKAEVDNQGDSLHCTRHALAKAITEGKLVPYP